MDHSGDTKTKGSELKLYISDLSLARLALETLPQEWGDPHLILVELYGGSSLRRVALTARRQLRDAQRSSERIASADTFERDKDRRVGSRSADRSRHRSELNCAHDGAYTT